MGFEAPPPDVIKKEHVKYWWYLIFLFGVVAVCRCICKEIMDGFIIAILAFAQWYMIREDCERMSQCCLMWMGVMCLMQGLFDLIPLFAALDGRDEHHRESTKIPGSKEGEHATLITSWTVHHGFFDGSQDWVYNFQSVMMIVTPITMFIGVALSRYSYMAFDSSIFNIPGLDDEERNLQGGRGGYYGGGYGNNGGYANNGGGSQGVGSVMNGGGSQGSRLLGRSALGQGGPTNSSGTRWEAFSGQGNRLGSS
eukprot:gnl/TRDRNA2_/TRDRNA2_168061_c0_seq2.p1 gnl/TRDRNA2_/TRDRNA2_168061_c0~~gnl/TRDRNA2_/TRDRNA2_168061_c0_seq2.p1  ORF type:complete len:292 (+),score=52.68 gnl/TRDRNA2_/TRDRNA2_168061_c0_seq2:118-876(+)